MEKVNVIIPTSNEYRIRMFDKYFNILDLPHNMNIIFLADDRGNISKEKYNEIFYELKNKAYYSLYFTSDLIESVRPYFSNAKYFNDILKLYGVSIKKLIFIWAKKTMNINKSFLLDDDVLFLKPIDEFYYANAYVRKKDPFSKLCKRSASAVRSTYPEVNYDEFVKKKLQINSGSIIYTWDDNHNLINWMNRFFDSTHIYEYLKERYDDFHSGKSKNLWGISWQIEQWIYGLFMYSCDELQSYASFGNIVNTSISRPEKIKPLQKLHHIIHFLNRDKIPVYEYYIARLEATDLTLLK